MEKQLAYAGVLICTLCAVLISAPFVSAQWRTSQDAEVCVSGTGVLSLDIAVCGRALGHDELSDLGRASVHTARGRAYRNSGRPGAAIADFDAALELNPYSANAFHERALTLEEGGHHEQALGDFRRALALSPRFADAYKNRGVAYFYASNLACARIDIEAAATLAPGDAELLVFRGFVNYLSGRYLDAAADFRRARALGLPYPYLSFWQYLAEAGSGMSDRTVLHDARAELLPGEWPQPLLDVYLGDLEPASLIAMLEDDNRPAEGRLAASHYYLAALELLHGRHEEALPHLASTLKRSRYNMPERMFAEHELADEGAVRLSRPPDDC